MTSICDYSRDPEPCALPVSALGLCRKHYTRVRRNDPADMAARRIARANRVVETAVRLPCVALDINGTRCDRARSWGAFCAKHHRRVRLYGDARIAHVFTVAGVRVNTVMVHGMRKAAADGASLLTLAEENRLPLDYVAAVVDQDRGWHDV